MANWYEKQATYTELGDTIVVGKPAFVTYFYSREGLEYHAQAIFNAWLALMDPKISLYYSHDDTKRIFDLNKKGIEKVNKALSPQSIKKGEEYAHYYAKSGPAKGDIDECHGYSFEIYTTSEDDAYVYIAFPLDFVSDRGVNTVINWFKEWCEKYPFTHAGAGFGYEIAWFSGQASPAYPVMFSTAMRYHGVRMFHRSTAYSREPIDQTLDTVSWLTYLDRATLEKLEPGAIDNIDPGVIRHPCGEGILLQAGSEPDPCDVNRPSRPYELLRSVNAAIIPVRTTAWYKNWFASDDPDKENGWFSRMDG